VVPRHGRPNAHADGHRPSQEAQGEPGQHRRLRRSVTDQGTRRSLRQRKYRAGTTLDVGAGTDYEFLEPNVDVGKLEGFPRHTGLRLVQGTGLAEYVTTGDCSNAALASLQISEGPMAAEIEFFQQDIMDCIERPVILRALEWGIRWGHLAGRLEEMDEALEFSAPKFQRRDRKKEVSADRELVTARAMSTRTMAERDALDPDQEQERIAEEEERQTYPDPDDDKDDRDDDRDREPDDDRDDQGDE
jgi:hypothetical protein